MSRKSDQSHAVQLGWHLDLAAMVADMRAGRAESLPEDNVFALALALLASALDDDELIERLNVPEEVLEGAGRHLHSQVRHELVRRFLNAVVTEARRKEEDNVPDNYDPAT